MEVVAEMFLCLKKPLESDQDGDGSGLKENWIHDRMQCRVLQAMTLLNTALHQK